jgi:hypothetical protein
MVFSNIIGDKPLTLSLELSALSFFAFSLELSALSSAGFEPLVKYL